MQSDIDARAMTLPLLARFCPSLCVHALLLRRRQPATRSARA
jgi:hypothetical protein